MSGNILSPLERDGESGRGRERGRRRWVGPQHESGGLQSGVNPQLREDGLYADSHGFERDRQQRGDLLTGAPAGEKLKQPLLLFG